MAIPDSYLVPTDHLFNNKPPKTVTRTYVDWDKFLDGGYHTLLQGRTGSGKTTLLLTLLKILHKHGHRILMRDDGGLEFLHLLPEIPIKIWIPEGTEFNVETKHQHLVKHFRDPEEILNEVYDSAYRFHVIIYDAYCLDPGPSATFYNKLFKKLIYRCMQTPRDSKEPLVVSFDELNDLIQPHGRGLTKEHSSVKNILEYNVRKLRKHRVTLIASTHRFNQVGINVRSQFSYIIIKQSYGSDVYSFINDNMVTVENKAFWKVLRDLTTMPPQYAYVFDYKNNFDKLVFPDIPRPKIKYWIDGEVKALKQIQEKQFTKEDIYIALARAGDPPESYRSIGRRVGLHHSTVSAHASKIKKSLKIVGDLMK